MNNSTREVWQRSEAVRPTTPTNHCSCRNRHLFPILLLFAFLLNLGRLWPTTVMAAPRLATPVTSPITTNTTWTKNNSPYQVTGSFTLVPQGLTLTIEPGVEVIFAGNTPPISGHLVANGTASEPILFTSVNKTPGGWGGLRIQSPSQSTRASVTLSHVVSEYAGLINNTTGGHLHLFAANATITNVTFRNGGSHGVAMTLDSNVTITDSTFTGNGRDVITVSGAATTGSAHFQNLSASGNGADLITYNNPFIRSHYTLANAGLPYQFAPLTVDKGGKLTIAPGTQLRMQGAPLVRGELVALGAAGLPITFTSASGVAGGWSGLQIAGDAQQMARATFDHVVLEHGGVVNSQTANLRVSTAVVTVTNSIIRNGGAYGIYVQSNDTTQWHGLTVADSAISGHPAGAIYVVDAMIDPVVRNLNLHDNGVNGIIRIGGLLGEHRWQNNGVPYVIRELLVINPPSKLVIDPGAVVRFEQNAALDVQGTLRAIGTAAQPVFFTGTQEQPGWWRAIRASAANSILDLRYCDVGYGGAPWINFANAMVQVGNNGGVIENCRLHHSGRVALFANVQSRPLVQYNRFEENTVGYQTDVRSIVPLDARNNWWGHPSGPTHASNPGGTGNAVGDSILFKPWLTDPNETGAVDGKLVLNITGPRQFVPGSLQLYTIYYANLTDQSIHDSVLRVLLPGYAEYVEHTGAAARWPQRHELFWKLGTLAPDANGMVTVRVRFERGLPATVRNGIVAQLSGSDLPKKPFDEAPYLSYVSPLPAVERSLSAAEVATERATYPALAQHYDQAVALGYRFGSALTRHFNTGESQTQITLLRLQPKIKVYYLWRNGETVVGGELDGASFTVRRGGQGMRFAVASGEWTSVTTDVRAADSGIDWSECMKNCIIEKLPGNLLEKASRVFNIAVKSIDCIKAIQGDQEAITDCAKALEKLVPGVGEGIDLGKCNADCEQCNGSCNSDKCHCCTQDKKLCDNSDWLYGAIGISVKKQMRCDLDTGRYLAAEVYETCALCEQCVQSGSGPACVTKPSSLTATAALAITQSPDGDDATESTCEVCRPARDPNDIVGPTGDLLPGQRVTYTINYENVGAGDALDVFIVNKLSQHFDPTTLQFSSNNAVYSPHTHTIYWAVGDLAPKDQPGSKGAVTYSVQLKPGLLSSTVISNSAVVHFPSVPEETPTNVVINLIKPLAADPLALSMDAGQTRDFILSGRELQNAPLTFAIVEGPAYGTLTGQPPVLRYTPGNGFAGQDRIVFTVNNGVATSSPADVQIEVKPNGAADQLAPSVLNTTPEEGGTANVSTVAMPAPGGPFYGPRIAATFSEALDPSTVTANAVTMTSAGQSIPVTVRYNATTDQIEILLRTPLQLNQQYDVEVKPTVTDRVGNPLPTAYQWRFTAVDEVAPPPAPVLLTVQVEPQAGGVVSGQGIDCGADCSESFALGAQVALTAMPADGYQFSGWAGACTGTAGCTVLMDGAKTVVATFTPVQPVNHTLTVQVVGNGVVRGQGIDCGADCSEPFPVGATIDLQATPADGFQLAGWSGACSGTAACQVRMDGDKQVTATFTAVSGGSHLFYLSSSKNGKINGLKYSDEDILAFDPSSGQWAMLWDGSDVGVHGDLDDFARLADGSILMSFEQPVMLAGIVEKVEHSDLVRFVPTSLGSNTAGSFELYFDGSDVELTTNNEDVDAFDLLADGTLLLSTRGPVNVTGVAAGNADLLRFTPTTLGVNTAGSWSLYFRGADVGFDQPNESVRAVWAADDGSLHLTSEGNFSLSGGFTGDGNDIFVCTPGTLGTPTACTFRLAWDGGAFGFDGAQIDGVDLAPVMNSMALTNTERVVEQMVEEQMMEEEEVIDESDLVDDNDVLDDSEAAPAEEAADQHLFLPLVTR
ncbi:MAG: hypothetical protein DYG89_52165 [Caldilinea sp. CFX5]|nr:hypothetical protein [Caldilinea sp. CFX5]